MQLSTVTQKGQVTIPISLRKKWDLKPNQKVVFVEKENVVEVKPAVDFFSLRGSIKTKKKYSDKIANQAAKRYLAREYAQNEENS